MHDLIVDHETEIIGAREVIREFYAGGTLEIGDIIYITNYQRLGLMRPNGNSVPVVIEKHCSVRHDLNLEDGANPVCKGGHGWYMMREYIEQYTIDIGFVGREPDWEV